MLSEYIYLGTAGYIVKVGKVSGEIKWRTKLSGVSWLSSSPIFTSLLVEEQRVYAHTMGELFCIDSATGEVLWNNPLSGLGNQLGTLATELSSSSGVQAQQIEDDKAQS